MCSPVPVSFAMHAPRALDTSQTFDLPRQLLLCSYSQLVLFCVFCFTSVIKIAYSTKMVAYHDFFFFYLFLHQVFILQLKGWAGQLKAVFMALTPLTSLWITEVLKYFCFSPWLCLHGQLQLHSNSFRQLSLPCGSP